MSEEIKYRYYLYPKALFEPIESVKDYDDRIEEAYPHWVYPEISKEARKQMFINILIMLRKDWISWGEVLPRRIPCNKYLQVDIKKDDYLIRKWTFHYGKKIQIRDSALLDRYDIDHFSKIVQARIDAACAATSKRRKK